MEGTFWHKDRWIKNTRDDVINLAGELRNSSIHPDSPKTISTTASAVTVSTGKRTIKILNFGSKDCYMGDSNVTSANGLPLYANGESILFENVKDNFTVYFICATGDSTTLRILEF